MSWIAFTLVGLYVLFGGIGLSNLRPGTPLTDPESLAMILFGLSAVVMFAVGIRAHLRFDRNSAAILGPDPQVVITADRLRSALFAIALILAVPEEIFTAHASTQPLTWGMAPALAYFAVRALRKASKPATLAVIGPEGIAAPQVWMGTIRWQDLADIHVGRTETTSRLRLSMSCLALIFREGASTPQRVNPSKPFDAHLALGNFMLMPSWIDLSLDDAINGLNLRLERHRE
jgi:hypothetical protein